MNFQHGTAIYTTRAIADRDAGSAGLDLYCEAGGQPKCVARIAFWDASGQFAFQTFKEIPLVVVEELIAEAKQTIKT